MVSLSCLKLGEDRLQLIFLVRCIAIVCYKAFCFVQPSFLFSATEDNDGNNHPAEHNGNYQERNK
jgi:hypothetical protein